MKFWQKVLVLLGLAILAVTSAQEEGSHVEAAEACNFDKAGLTDNAKRDLIMEKVRPCFTKVVSEEQAYQLQASPDLHGFQNFFRDFCPHVQKVASCVADVRHTIANCQSRAISRTVMVLLELVEHLMIAGCENNGDRLAHLGRGVYLLIKEPDTLGPLGRCTVKGFAILSITQGKDLDLTSESYLFYHNFAKLGKCLEYIDDETYKTAAQWLLNEVATSMKCKHPEEDTFVRCSELDVSKVPVTSICKMEPLNNEHLFDFLEGEVLNRCYNTPFNHDKYKALNYTSDLSWLQEEYKRICKHHRQTPECHLKLSAFGESCLSHEENKEFQLEVDGMEDYMSRLCVEDGVFLAEFMHHVYMNTAEHGHALRECYKIVTEADNGLEGHAASSKSMRFYHGTMAYKTCVVGKLHATSDLASRVETAFNDVLKKMKCVNHSDGSVVLCETIHEH